MDIHMALLFAAMTTALIPVPFILLLCALQWFHACVALSWAWTKHRCIRGSHMIQQSTQLYIYALAMSIVPLTFPVVYRTAIPARYWVMMLFSSISTAMMMSVGLEYAATVRDILKKCRKFGRHCSRHVHHELHATDGIRHRIQQRLRADSVLDDLCIELDDNKHLQCVICDPITDTSLADDLGNQLQSNDICASGTIELMETSQLRYVMLRACGHHFHHLCLGKWFTMCNRKDRPLRCPLCRIAADEVILSDDDELNDEPNDDDY